MSNPAKEVIELLVTEVGAPAILSIIRSAVRESPAHTHVADRVKSILGEGKLQSEIEYELAVEALRRVSHG